MATELPKGEFRERVIYHVGEFDHAFHQTLLGVEGQIVRQARLVHLAVGMGVASDRMAITSSALLPSKRPLLNAPL